MKILNTTAIAALLSCSMMTPANAAITATSSPSTSPTAEMTAQCNTYLDSLNSMYAPRVFSSVAVENVTYAITWGAATNSVPDNSTRQPLGTVTGYSNLSFEGVTVASLGRTGGSPNMFSDAVTAHTVSYSNSSVRVTDTFPGSVLYNYFCTPTEKITIPGNPATPDVPAVPGVEEGQNECVARVKADLALQATAEYQQYASAQSTNGAPGAWCQEHKLLIGGSPAIPGTPATPDTYDYRPDYSLSKGFELAGGTVTGTDTRTDYNAGPWTFTGQNLTVTALVCNNPGAKGGTWRNAGGYAGGLCAPITNSFYTYARTLAGNNFGVLYPSNSVPQ